MHSGRLSGRRVYTDVIGGPTIGKTIEERGMAKEKSKKVWQRSKEPEKFVLHRMHDRLKLVFL
jgi:hypothetical protein